MTNKSCGYILCVSYGGLPFLTSCDLYKAVETVISIGPLTLKINLRNNTIQDIFLAHQEQFIKPSSNSPISTNILGNENYSWISAILFSKVEPHLLLEEAEKLLGIDSSGEKNDFVLLRNPVAKYPLAEDIFSSRTRITLENSNLVISGFNIFLSL